MKMHVPHKHPTKRNRPMTKRFRCLVVLSAALALWLTPALSAHAAPPAAPSDPLNRTNPRSAVTAFLVACQANDYTKAAEYLDLHQIPTSRRTTEGPELAKQLEAILNSDSHFNVLQLSQSPQGNLTDDPNPSVEHVATINRDGKTYSITLERSTTQTPAKTSVDIWVFSPATISEIPRLAPAATNSAIESRLPHFLVSVQFLETPIWKWLALLIFAVTVVTVFRLIAHLAMLLIRKSSTRLIHSNRWLWVQPFFQAGYVLLAAIAFIIAEQFIDPSALSRLYVGRAILLILVFSFAWCFVNLVDLLLSRVDSLLDPRQRLVSHSLIYFGRRTANVAIFVIAAIIVLDNWGYNMTTMIAGLGVGGIAVALAAQGTIANVFGGVSIIGDHPVMVGDFGNFGGVLGNVEDIGMRSTRVRTLNRTVMSIPNSSFATMNLENYALRDKILFNPTLQIKRGTPKDKLRQIMKTLADLLRNDKRLEVGPSPIRLTGLSAASISLEIFAYTLTEDIDQFYKIQADLFLEIDEALASGGIELA